MVHVTKKRVRSTFKLLVKTSVSYSVILWLIIMIFPQLFAGMFTSDSTLLVFTKTALRIYMAVVFIFGIQIACQMTFISLGRAKDPSLWLLSENLFWSSR